MKHLEDYFTGLDDLKLYYQVWRPDEPPKAVIQIIPGYASHSGRQSNIVNELVPRGYVVYANDHRGHGKSEGITLYVKKFEKFIEDQKIFFDLIEEKESNLPHFILGHSMGATIVEFFAVNYQESLDIRGIVLSGVGLKIRAIKGAKKGLAKFLGAITPKLRLTVDEAPYLSRDPAVVESYREDPLVYKNPTVKIGVEFANAVSKAKKIVDQIKIPTLVQFGAADNVMLNGEEFAELLTMPDKTVKIYDGCLHEIYNEIEEDRTTALRDLSDWLDKHVA